MSKNETKFQAARYYKFVTWSAKDKVFIGRCPALFDGAVHGTDEAAVYQELVETVEEWIVLLRKDGAALPRAGNKKYSGKFLVRSHPSLHQLVEAKAMAAGESLNEYVVKALAKAA